MKYRPLGNSGIEVSEIGLGANTISGMGSNGYVDESDGIAAVERAHDLGVTFFDTAESYSEGRSEEVLGRVLGNKPDVVICTKVGGRDGEFSADHIRSAAEASLRRLRRDVIDVYLAHNPSIAQIHDPAIRDAMESLKRDGLIRSYGVSARTGIHVESGEEVAKVGAYTSVQVPLSVGQQEVAVGVLPRAQERGVGIIVRVPLASGLLTGKYDSLDGFAEDDPRGTPGFRTRMEPRMLSVEPLRELAKREGVSIVHAALAWVLSHDAVSVTIPGCKNAAQVEDNVAASDITLSEGFVEGVRALALA